MNFTLQSTRFRIAADKSKPVETKDLKPIINDLENLFNELSAFLSSAEKTIVVRLSEENNVDVSNAPATFDGVAAVDEDKVALFGNTSADENGVWVFHGVGLPLTRFGEMDESDEVQPGMTVYVQEGDTKADSAWILVTDEPITIGTTSLEFTRTSYAMRSLSVAQAQALSAFQPNQLYLLTNATFQGAPQSFIAQATDNGDGLQASGYIHIGGIIYPADYDLANDAFSSFYDPQYNNKISRPQGSGFTCVDNFPIGNAHFQNCTIKDSSLTIDPLGFMIGVEAGAGNIITLSNASQLQYVQMESNSAINLSGGSTLYNFTMQHDNNISISGGCLFRNCTIGSHCTVNGSNSAVVERWTLLDNAMITINASTTLNCVARAATDITIVSTNDVNANTFAEASTLNANGSGGTALLTQSHLGAGSSLTITDGSLTGFRLGETKSMTLSNGDTLSSVRYDTGFSNVPVTKDITTGDKLQFAFFYGLGSPQFADGEVVTDTTTGSTATVVSSTLGILTISGMNGFFQNGDSLTGGTSGAAATVNADPSTADSAVVVPYDTLVGGPFDFGETVTTAGGASGVVVHDNLVDTLILGGVDCTNDDFANNTAITGGGSGATALVDGQTTYTDVDLTGIEYAGRVTLASSNANETIGGISNATGDQARRFTPDNGVSICYLDNSKTAQNIYVSTAYSSTNIKDVGANDDYVEFILIGGNMKYYNASTF